jgi:molybdopterin molybdotransferase
MLSLEQAQQEILARIDPLPIESVALAQALGRSVAHPVLAPSDLPPFDNSAMDGYAVRSEDVATATLDQPVVLRLIGSVAAGQACSGQIGRGECLRLFTGSPLPPGADAVIMQEDTRPNDSGPSHTVRMLDPVKPWENVRFQGEDVKRGTPVATAGTRLGVGQIGLLAAVGQGEVAVHRQPVVGLIATGSELREPGEPLGAGQIYESNRATLALLAAQAGAQPRLFPLVPDDLAATEQALRAALSQCDAVVTSGGVSVGDKDLVKPAFARIGGGLSFWRVAIKPGKPFALGTCGGKLLFALPGNPVSAFVTFLLLVRPALLKMQGATELSLPVRSGILDETIANLGSRRHFVRVILDEHGRVRSAGAQASHMLSSLALANGLVDFAPGMTLPAGAEVSVSVWQ